MCQSYAPAFVLTLALLAAGAVQASDPPAADTSGPRFFVKAAEYREASADLSKAAGDTLERAAHFLFSDTGIENAMPDENGKKVPPYIYHAVIDDDNHFSYRSSFPAYHDAYLIEAFLNYYNYSGNPESIRRSVEIADWMISHSTPADWKWPNLPWSTFTEGKPGGYEDKDTLQPDKTGYMGLAYTRLYEVTRQEKYFDAARKIAAALVARQGKDGSWPFRVNPRTGEVYQQYTAAIFLNVAFLEKMYSLTGNLDDKNAQIGAWMWMLRNPVRTNDWSGLYEDIAKGSNSQVHYSPAQTIRLLLRYTTPVNADSYLDHARKLFDFTMDGLAFDDRDYGLILREQTGYLAATPSSTLNWSMMSAEFFLATGDVRYRTTTSEALRMVTRYGLKPDGRTNNTVMGGRIYGNNSSWYSLTSPVVRYIYQDMGCLPEFAPEGQTHLLRTSTQIRHIEYHGRHVAFESLPDSIDLMKVATAPVAARAGGRQLPVSATLDSANGFLYNPRSHVLVVRHADPHVEIELQP